MRNQAVRLWAKAVESGRFIQGKGNLCRDSKHCCLGVACEVFLEQGGVLAVKRQGTVTRVGFAAEYRDYFGGNGNYLPLEVAEWLGIPLSETQKRFFNDREGDPRLPVRDRDGFTLSLSTLNDDGLTFPQIADVIRYFFMDKE